MSSLSIGPVISKLISSYSSDTPATLKIIDSYLVFILLSGIIQFAYVIVAGAYPFNAFLAGFISTVASFVFAASLRMQCNPKNSSVSNISPERAFADFIVCHVFLHFFVVNFLG
ncbi:defender against cell death 1-like molecule [Paraphysoderma sedebokerense]|nr:defender against cell death 1-like molecule [Paraphysoderma sedebokerense]